MDNNLAIKIYTLEAEHQFIKEKIKNIEQSLENNAELILDMKGKIDEWNGSMPHIINNLESISDEQKKILESLKSENKDKIENALKTKILWGALVFIASAFGALILHKLEILLR